MSLYGINNTHQTGYTCLPFKKRSARRNDVSIIKGDTSTDKTSSSISLNDRIKVVFNNLRDEMHKISPEFAEKFKRPTQDCQDQILTLLINTPAPVTVVEQLASIRQNHGIAQTSPTATKKRRKRKGVSTAASKGAKRVKIDANPSHLEFCKEFKDQLPVVSLGVRILMENLSKDKSLKFSESYPALSSKEREQFNHILKESRKTGLPSNVEIVSKPDSSKKGIFATKPINAGDVLGLYSGEYIVTSHDSANMLDSNYVLSVTEWINLSVNEFKAIPKKYTNHKYENTENYKIICYAKEYGNWTRYLTDGGNDSNVSYKTARIQHKKDNGWLTDYVFILFANRDIENGAELQIAYT